VSRAYYAAFHVAKELLEDAGIALPNTAEAHRNMQLCLAESEEVIARQAAEDLGALRNRRNAADYDLRATKPARMSFVELQIVGAKTVVSALAACRTGTVWPRFRARVRTYAAHEALDRWGYGLASVRFICGTQQIHKQLEAKLSDFLGTEATILYSSCFDANGGLFETLLGPEDAIISDELNHASIIDGVRLCNARRYRYKNNDLCDLEEQLCQAADARFRLIATDGVFSMDGIIANLADICDLADKHNALVMVDDSHAVGFMGKHGRGTHEYHGVIGRVDILTGTLGKALGDAALAARMAEAMLRRGVYVVGFSYPVVPQGKARIRVQVSAGHSTEDLEFAMEAFSAAKEELVSVGKRLSLQAGGGHGGLRRTGTGGPLRRRGIGSASGCRSQLWFESSAHNATTMAVESGRMRGDHATRLRSE
jgi:hypothetical protein